MNDKYKKNKFNGRPMAVRNMNLPQKDIFQYEWIDRLILKMYIALSVTILTISVVMLVGLSG